MILNLKGVLKILLLCCMIVFLYFPLVVKAQNRADSLLRNLEFQTGEERLKTLSDLTWVYGFSQPQQAIFYGKLGIELAEKLNNPKAKIDIINFMGIAQITAAEFEKAYQKFEKARQLSIDINYQKGLGDAYNNFGRYYYTIEKYPQAYEYFMKSFQMRESINDLQGMAASYNNMALIDIMQGSYEDAQRNFNKSYQTYQEAGDLLRAASIVNNLGNMYGRTNNHEKALEAYLRAEEIFLGLGMEHQVATARNNIASAKMNLGDYEGALEYGLKALEYREKTNNQDALLEILNNMGKLMINLQNYPKAIEFLTKAETLLENRDNQSLKQSVYNQLGLAYEGQRNFEQAQKYTKLALILKDSVFTADKSKAVEEMKNKFELEKYQAELNDALEQSFLQEASFRRLSKVSIGIGVLLVLALILALNLYRTQKQNKLINARLSESNRIIAQQNESLLDLNKEKDYFLSIVAHDIANQLANIQGLLTLIQHDKNVVSDEQKAYLDRATSITGNLVLMVRKVLDIRNLEQAELIPDMKKVSVKEVVEDILDSYREASSQKNIQVNFESKAGDAWVWADFQFISQVVDNLISNAIKFSSSGMDVDILVEEQADQKIILAVADRGPGVPEKDRSRMFGKYQRLSAKPTAGETSTGLGLSIIKKYMGVMKGEVWYEDRPEGGAIFKISLSKA